jgi:hypothetical protein
VARLIYSAITSLDGYVTDDEGRFEWAQPEAMSSRPLLSLSGCELLLG